MTTEVVIARYKEDISWISNVDKNVKISLYEKYEQLPIGREVDSRVSLPNIGNEAHTYIFHIVRNYNQISDITHFVQGRPFDHSPNALDFINGKIHLKDDYVTMCESLALSDKHGLPHHPGLPVGNYYKKIFGSELNDTLTFGAGAQFSVTKKAIQLKPLEFWSKLLVLSEDTSTAPFAFERLWHKIFEC